MQNFFTKKEDVKGTVAIWARTNIISDVESGANPFYYELRTDSPWSDDAIKVVEFPVTLVVPEGIELLAKTVETLKAKKKEIESRAYQEVLDLDKKIDGLLMLDFIPIVDRDIIKAEPDLDAPQEIKNLQNQEPVNEDPDPIDTEEMNGMIDDTLF